MSYPGNNDSGNAGLYIAAAVAILCVVAWFVFRDEIIWLVMKIFWVVFFVADKLVGGRTVTPGDLLVVTEEVARNPKMMGFAGLRKVMSVGGEYLRWVLIPPLAFLAWKLWHHPIQHYREKMTVKRFLERQSSIWKPVVPVLHLDLINGKHPGWEPPAHGTDLARKHQVVFNRQLNRGRTREIFVAQLGDRLHVDLPNATEDAAKRRRLEREMLVKQLGRMKPHEKALFAVFALRIDRKAKAAQKLLNELNESARGTGKPDFGFANEPFERYRKSGQILMTIYPHLYVRTALVQMLCEARKFDGVLPPAEFIWLRPIDPPLFYALNRTPIVPERLHTPSFGEGAGILAQWQAERVAWNAEFRLKGPWVESAVDGLDEDLEASGMVDPKLNKLAMESPANRMARPGKGNIRR